MVLFTIYWVFQSSHSIQNTICIIGSCIFYAWWDPRFLLLVIFTAAFNYLIGNKVANENKHKKSYLAFGILVNLLILCFFKYYNFFIDSFLNLFSVQSSAYVFKIILPLGISFFTFQAISYIVDVFRGSIAPTSKFSDFFLFLIFFPQLVAGPIERAKDFIPQILARRSLKFEIFLEGCWLILWGLCKKIVIADNLAMIVDPIFSHSEEYKGAVLLLALLAFTFQIYCDFSGYTDMARGIAKLLGFELSLNFNFPYLSRSPSEFWTRWHISLSRWLKDYLYISLGGNRAGKIRTQLNLVITMVLGGLWHGAAWNYVLWGLYHGTLLVAYKNLAGLHYFAKKKLFRAKVQMPGLSIFYVGIPLNGVKNNSLLLIRGIYKYIGKQKAYVKIAQVIPFFLLTVFGWLLFRVENFEQIIYFISYIGIDGFLELGNELDKFSVLIAFLLVVELCLLRTESNSLFFPKSPVLSGLIGGVMITVILVSSVRNSTEFVYFQF